LQDIKEQPTKESSVDQQTEEKEDKPNDSTELDKREDKPNDSTELDKGREKITQDELQAIEREKVCVPFIYLPILEREKVCVSFIYLPILEREKVSKKTVHYLWCFGPCGLKFGMGWNGKKSKIFLKIRK
jgi:hypothetical protein